MRLKESALVVVAAGFMLYQTSLSFAQSPAISNGLSYLHSSQTPAGYWGDATEVPYNSFVETCAIADSLRYFSGTNTSYSTAVQWINTTEVNNNDYLLSQSLILSQAGIDVSSIRDYLLSIRNSDGGWGVGEGITSDIKRTALTLQALKAVNYTDYAVLYQAVNYLTSNQNLDGGWGYYPSGVSDVFVTATALKTLSLYNNVTFSIQNSIDKAVAYMLSKQNADGGFGGSPSKVYETALVFDALIAAGANLSTIDPLTDRTPAQGAINYLTSTQQANGSWNDDPYSTALALQALANIRPNLSVSSLSLSKPMPREGETITITATVKNIGLDAASNVIVRFFSGDPASGGVQIGADQIISTLTLNSSTQVSVTDSFIGTGGKTIFVVVDPDNMISETSKSDNKASTRLWVATAPDLAVYSEDLKPSTYIPASGTAFTLAYTIRNLGESATGAFTVSVYDGDPNAGAPAATPLQTINISGLGGTEVRTGSVGVTLTGDGAHTLYMMADAGYLIQEISETNNTGSVTVQVGGVQQYADITAGGIQLTPSRPHANETVQISASVRNEGLEDASSFTVEIFDGAPESGGTLIHSEVISLASGTTRTITTNWTITAGIHDLCLIADRSNQINETNETNNRTSLRVMTDMVDIALSAADLSFNPVHPVSGDSVVLSVTVHNQGIKETGAFNLALYDGDPASGGALLQTFSISNIPGDGSATLPYTFTAIPWTYRFYAIADTENIVTELYESNNQAIRSLTIKSPGETYGPDLVPVKIDLSSLATDSQTLAISGSALVTFQNKGDAKITSSFDLLVFEDKDSDGRYTSGVDNLLGAATNTQALWPEGANMVSVPLSGAVKFLHSPLYALVDSGDAILEQDETNNLLVSCKDCQVVPSNPIQPVVKWKWRDPQPDCHNWTVILQPVAITPLTDTNGDGRADEKDDPFIIYVTNEAGSCEGGAGKIKAVNARTGQEAFTIHADPPRGMTSCDFVAAGDINNDHVPEIIILNYSPVTDIGWVDSISAYTYNGNGVTLLWNNWDKVYAYNKANRLRYQALASYGCTQPAIADIDGDGNPEIIAGPTVINGDGSIKWGYPIFYDWTGQGWPGHGDGMGYPKAIAADLDLDGKQEILAGNTAYNSDGTVKWWNKSLPDGRSVVVNFDGDPYPEILYGTSVGGWTFGGIRIYLLDHNGSIIWGPVYLNDFEPNASTFGAAEFVVADYDGDGEIEFGLRGYNKYYIFDKNGRLKSALSMPWIPTGGVWERSAPTVFDLNGDGRPEIISNTNAFRIYDGRDGAILHEEGFAGGLFDQSVIVSDVERDGHADIVAFGHYGINVYGAKNNDWVAARTIWNQASYHVTNVNDDGSIPQHEAPSWLLNNTYHTQAAIAPAANPYLAPNLTASYFRANRNGASVNLTVRIGNGGAKEAQTGATVTFYDGDPASGGIVIGMAATTKILQPGEYQDVILSASNLSEGLHHVYAVVDAGNAVSECREDDNRINTDITVVTGLPDLKGGVEDIVLPLAPYAEGSIVPITVNIKNIGAVSASNASVRLYDGNPATGGAQIGATQTISAISAGGAETVSIAFDTLGRTGTNMLYVVLDQENVIIESNETNNIALFTLDVQTPQLPNLAITPEGIQLAPSSAQEGERVTITATITNRGAATGAGAGAIPVRFYLGDPAAGGLLIAEQSIYTILTLGQAATVTATLDTTGVSGQQSTFIVVDPSGMITESKEGDNIASKALFIQAAGLTSSITLDKTSYQPSEAVTAMVTASNTSGVSRTLTFDLFVKDSAGNLIAAITQAEPVTIGPNSGITLTRTWNTGKTMAGNYSVFAEVAEEERTISRANANFSITPDKGLDAKVTVDKMAYNPKETVALSATVASQSANYIFENLTAKLTIAGSGVQGPGAGAICTEAKTIAALMPEAVFTFKSYCPAATAHSGTYTARLEVLSGQTVLASSSAEFEVLSTSRTGAGLSGAIIATTDPVYQGREETFSISITNNGIDDLPGLAVSVIVADPDTGAMKTEAVGQTIAVGQGQTITGTVSASTLPLEPKKYLAVLQVRTAEMTQPKTLASVLFEVKPGIEVTKRIPDLKNVLVWLNYPWQSGKNCPDRVLIEQALSQAGVTYHIVLDKKDFAAELENIFYTDIMVLGDHHPLEDHVADVLASKISEGQGLISSLFNRQSLNEPVLGIKFTGTLSGEGYVVDIPGNELGIQGSFPSAGRVLKVEALHPEEAIAWTGTAGSSGKGQGAREETERHPAIIKRQYGEGKVIFLAFDLAMSSANIPGFPALLGNALDAVHTPLTAPYRPGLPVPVELSVKSLGAAFDVRIAETYPTGIRLYDPASGHWIENNPWVTDLRLEPNEEKTLLFYALPPEQPGIYTLRSEVGYLDNGAYAFYQEFKLDIEVGRE